MEVCAVHEFKDGSVCCSLSPRWKVALFMKSETEGCAFRGFRVGRVRCSEMEGCLVHGFKDGRVHCYGFKNGRVRCS